MQSIYIQIMCIINHSNIEAIVLLDENLYTAFKYLKYNI